jgi:hypothetical protein
MHTARDVYIIDLFPESQWNAPLITIISVPLPTYAEKRNGMLIHPNAVVEMVHPVPNTRIHERDD